MRSGKQNELMAQFNELANNAQLLIAVSAIIVVLDVFFLLRWQWTTMGRLFKETKQLADEARHIHDSTVMSPGVKTQVENMKTEVAALNKMIVTEESLPSVIESISKFGDRSGIKILSIKPIRETAAAAAASKDNFTKIKINVSGLGGFHQLGRFVALLENAPVFLNIVNLEIRTGDQDFLQHSLSIVLEVVMRKA